MPSQQEETTARGSADADYSISTPLKKSWGFCCTVDSPGAGLQPKASDPDKLQLIRKRRRSPDTGKSHHSFSLRIHRVRETSMQEEFPLLSSLSK